MQARGRYWTVTLHGFWTPPKSRPQTIGRKRYTGKDCTEIRTDGPKNSDPQTVGKWFCSIQDRVSEGDIYVASKKRRKNINFQLVPPLHLFVRFLPQIVKFVAAVPSTA
jgi:hypothetical protein